MFCNSGWQHDLCCRYSSDACTGTCMAAHTFLQNPAKLGIVTCCNYGSVLSLCCTFVKEHHQSSWDKAQLPPLTGLLLVCLLAVWESFQSCDACLYCMKYSSSTCLKGDCVLVEGQHIRKWVLVVTACQPIRERIRSHKYITPDFCTRSSCAR